MVNHEERERKIEIEGERGVGRGTMRGDIKAKVPPHPPPERGGSSPAHNTDTS